jgi:hypothetical protein
LGYIAAFGVIIVLGILVYGVLRFTGIDEYLKEIND